MQRANPWTVSRPLVLLLPLLAVLAAATPALAHKVNLFAYAEDGTIYTESYFPDGRKVENGTVEVYDHTGKKLLTGTTDKEGRFDFPVPAHDDLTIVINATMGHKNSFVLKKEELQ